METIPTALEMPETETEPAPDAIESKRFTWTSYLAFPLVALLFAQWPLREVVQVYSRQANDLGQILFAIYVAVAVTAATRAGVHLSSASHSEVSTSRSKWRSWALVICTLPWAAFMLWSGWRMVVQSTLSLEHFSETQSPGYFVIKLAMALMALLVLLDGLLRVV